MRLNYHYLLLGLGIALFTGCDGASGGGAMKTSEDSVSYAIGMNIGTGVKQDSVMLNMQFLKAGYEDVVAGAETVLSDSGAQATLIAFQELMMKRGQERMAREGEENKKKGDEFLATNKTKPGVQTTPSGLQYLVKSPGDGESADSNDVVKIEFRGTLIDGTEFDRSQPGNPATFPVIGVIPGFSEALMMMQPGAEWTIFIPGNLAYGPGGGPGGKIGPNETLIFDVKLIEVEKK